MKRRIALATLAAGSACLIASSAPLFAQQAPQESAVPQQALPAAPAQPGAITPYQRLGSGASVDLSVLLYKSRVVSLDAPVGRVSVGNPDIADIVVIRPTELYVLGKDIGTTNVYLWDRDNRLIGSMNIEVTHDLSSLKSKLYQLLPGHSIEVHSAQRSVVLTGTVPDAATMNAAVRLAEGYLAQIQTAEETQTFEQQTASRREDRTVGAVINLLQVGGSQQVMLEVKVAEIRRDELRRLNAQFNSIKVGDRWSVGGVNGGATFPDLLVEPDEVRIPVFGGIAPAGPAVDEFAPGTATIPDQGLFASFLSRNFLFNLAIDAAKERGLAKILAEPTLTTQTGHEAKFLSGGEFPIPVNNGLNGISIEFKQFGVILEFLPVVLSGNRINVKISVTVSEPVDCPGEVPAVLSERTTQVILVPCLQSRAADGTIELSDGQTMGLAGLLNDNLREVVTKFPGLGSIPVLGALFRSQEFLKGETELLILVTPRLARPVAPGRVRLPTDSFVEPTDAEFFWLGRTEGRGNPESRGNTERRAEAAGGHQVN